MDGCAVENLCTASLGITSWVENGLLTFVRFSKLVQFQIQPLFNIRTVPSWLNVKFHYFLVDPEVKILNTFPQLAPIYISLLPMS
jgi:hypothetical protein